MLAVITVLNRNTLAYVNIFYRAAVSRKAHLGPEGEDFQAVSVVF